MSPTLSATTCPWGPGSSSEKGMTSPAQPGRGPMGTNGWKTGPLWPPGSSSEETGQWGEQDCQELWRCHLCPPRRGPPPEPAPLPHPVSSSCWRHMQGQWHMEGVAPAAQAGWLCHHTVTCWPQLTPVSRTRGDCTPGAACLCSKPHHSPVTDQGLLPPPETSALALSPVCPPGSYLQSPLLPPLTSGLLQRGQGSQHLFIHSFIHLIHKCSLSIFLHCRMLG